MNIYDLAGNITEGTLEKASFDGYPHATRGQDYSSSGSDYPVSTRCQSCAPDSYNFFEFRSTLYVN